MLDYKVTDTELASVANAIRTKGGTSAQLEWPTGFINAIGAIPSGGGDNWTALDTYIESSGTQYIDTGYVANENTIFECVANVASPNTTWGTLFGSRIGQNNKAIFFGIYGNNREAWVTPWLSQATEITSTSHNLYNTKAVYLISADSFGGYDLGNVVGAVRRGGSLYSNLSVYLFGLNTNGSIEVPCSAKLYRFRIYESDTLVHEFIPWVDSNNVVCLKDTVTGNIKYNAGTGNFIYGTDL